MRVTIIGTSGRKQDAKYVSVETFAWMLDVCHEETDASDTLMSAGAALADHVAVILALERKQPLILELPAPWDPAKRCFQATKCGGINNYYHRMFSKACGWDENQSLLDLHNAIQMPSTEVRLVDGFFARVSSIASDCDRLIAFTFNEPSPLGPSGGTGSTWRKCNKPKKCVVIPH